MPTRTSGTPPDESNSANPDVKTPVSAPKLAIFSHLEGGFTPELAGFEKTVPDSVSVPGNFCPEMVKTNSFGPDFASGLVKCVSTWGIPDVRVLIFETDLLNPDVRIAIFETNGPNPHVRDTSMRFDQAQSARPDR